MKTIAVLLATLTPALVAAYGESCSYYSGSKFGTIKGICGSPGECEYDALGYPVNDRCPGGNDNKCCIQKRCTTSGGKKGYCTTTASCNNLGWKHVSNLCPGPTNVQCCYQ